jgi:hypothetical protein
MAKSKKAEVELDLGDVLLWILKAVVFAILIVGLYFGARRVGVMG